MTEPIRAKVARILNSREVAITAGMKQGVVVGMLFDIMDLKGGNIKDPDTGEVLGTIERPKVRVRVTAVQELVSIASTFRKRRVNVGGLGLARPEAESFAKFLMPPKYETWYETLKTDEDTWEDLDEEESYVKTGDPVVQVFEESDRREGEQSQ